MKHLLHLLVALLVTASSLVVLASCDADDPSLDYTAQTYAIGRVSLPSSLTDQQRTVIGQLLDDMVLVEPCQFWMGAQGKTSTRANYLSSFSAIGDSMKVTVSVDENGDTTIYKNHWYVDYCHILDKRAYRHTLSTGTVRTDTIYYTQIYKMPTATGSDNGRLWVGPVTEMCMPDAYYIGRYEVTQAQWIAVMGEGEGKWPRGRRCVDVTANDRRDSAWYCTVGRGDNYPAYNVWYDDAVAFCERLNELCGMPNAEGLSFRLPTEAEWECAARGGRYSRGFKYPGSDTYTDVAWCNSNAVGEGLCEEDWGMHPHGELEANELGLYDMAGNVSEWCQNVYYRYTFRDSIASQSFHQRHLPQHAADAYLGDTLILRGGSWYQSGAAYFSSASRQEYTRGSADNDAVQALIMHCGLRLVLAK